MPIPSFFFGANGLINSGFFIFRSRISMEKIPFTRDGIKKIRAELARLEKEERPENIRAIEEARSHGDISENAEYHAAKERQSFLDGKINELKDVLGRAEVIDASDSPDDSVVFGRTVVLYDIQTDEEVIYKMVGPYESSPENGMISVTSPLGQALIGRKEGDEVQARTPGGILEFEILEIQ
jgi:transcription elongation factor GreA